MIFIYILLIYNDLSKILYKYIINYYYKIEDQTG